MKIKIFKLVLWLQMKIRKYVLVMKITKDNLN